MTLSRRLAERAIADGLVVGAVLGWWVLSLHLPVFVMPSPWQVGERLAQLFLTPSLLADTSASAARVVASVVLSTVIGGAVGWAILAMIWFGTTDAAVIFVEVAILTPFCLVNILEGLKELDTELIEMGSSFTRNGGRKFWKLVVPMLLPYTMSAIRIAYGIAWKIALVAELFGVSSGLGYLMLKAEIVSDSTTVYATCFAVVLLFLAGEKLVLDPLSRLVAYK